MLLIPPHGDPDDLDPDDDFARGPGGVHVRKRRAVDQGVAAEPSPTDPAVATLATRVRARYKVGSDSWIANAAGVRRELSAAGDTGLAAAVWIVERMRVAFRWELDFWTAEANLPTPADVRTGFAALPHNAQLNPYHNPSGYHPRIHLVAAAAVLTDQPRPEAAEPLAGLLEYWFGYAQHETELNSLDVTVLEALVRCYRATPTSAHPEFLVRVAVEGATCPVIDGDNVFSHVEGGVTYLDHVLRDRGWFDLSALAQAAMNR